MTNAELVEFTAKVNTLNDKDLESVFFILKGMLMARETDNASSKNDVKNDR